MRFEGPVAVLLSVSLGVACSGGGASSSGLLDGGTAGSSATASTDAGSGGAGTGGLAGSPSGGSAGTSSGGSAGSPSGGSGGAPGGSGGASGGSGGAAGASAGGGQAGSAGTGGFAGSGGGPTCGNGAVDAGEQCDGTNLAGHSCATALGPNAKGTLSCSSNCTFDTSQCCTPSCQGKACGPDGCGATCGSCSTGASCQSGTCVCTPHAASKCYGLELYWYDSCGKKEELKQDCPGTCSNGQCDAAIWRCSETAGLACNCLVTSDAITYPKPACSSWSCCFRYTSVSGDTCHCGNYDSTQCSAYVQSYKGTKQASCPP